MFDQRVQILHPQIYVSINILMDTSQREVSGIAASMNSNKEKENKQPLTNTKIPEIQARSIFETISRGKKKTLIFTSYGGQELSSYV